MPKTISVAAKDAISQAQKRRWAQWRQEHGGPVKPRRRRRVPVPDVLPVVNTPGTNGVSAEMSVALHLHGQVVQLTSEEAASVYDALGMVLHKHGLSTT